MIVHRLLKRQLDRLAMVMDSTLMSVLPFVVYPLITIITFLWGLDSEKKGYTTVTQIPWILFVASSREDSI
jgi:hypothetical protein